MLASRLVIVRVVSLRTLAISSRVRTRKSSSSPGMRPCWIRSRAAISSETATVWPADIADTVMLWM